MKHYFSIWWRIGLSLFGAGLLVFAAESDPPWVVIRDEFFIQDYASACISVWCTMAVQEYTLRWIDRLVPFRRRTRKYYIDRYSLQFFLSMLPTILCAVAMAFLWSFLLMDSLLWETYYFHYDIYIVGTGILAVQVILGFIHYGWSRDQFEEVDLVHEEGLEIYQRQERAAIPRQLNAAVQTYLLQNVENRQADTAVSGLEVQQRTLPPTKKDRQQWEVIHRLDWSDIAAFYSMGNSTYLVRWNGDVELLDASLSNIKRLMDVELYFAGAKSLIMHHNAVVGVTKLGNGQIKLTLEPLIPIDTKLSRAATQQFRKWYLT